METPLPQVIPSPNIWGNPEVYELENLGVDPDGVIESAMRQVHDWTGQHVLDVGCGSGFHLPRFGDDASLVTGVEPHPPLVTAARARVAASPGSLTQRLRVLSGSAAALPLDDSTVDVVHARWAYFFGPGCEPGLDELARVLRPGGTAFVVDNDVSRSTFGAWVRKADPRWDSPAIERFWARQGWTRVPLDIRWEFGDRAVFEQVVRIEFASDVADEILAGHPGTGVDYAVNLFWRRYP